MSINKKNYDVVILTYAPSDDLINSLNMILSQTIIPNKIVIYNTNYSIFCKNITDKTKLMNLISDNSEKIEVINIDESEFDHGKSRNDASKYCNSSYILFLTDDAVPYDNYMCENLLNSFYKYSDDESKVAVSYARQIPKKNAKLKEKYIREFNYPDYDIVKEKIKENILGIKNYFCSNVCAMYDRRVFNESNMFEENIILNEDTFYVYKVINAGYRVAYASEAKVIHSHNLSFTQQFSRNFDIGVSQFEKKEIFEKVPSVREGKKIVLYVTNRLLKGFHLILVLDFLIECVFRYFGYKFGYNYNRLSLSMCKNFASNKKYFIKNK